jgi:outer membrane protein OmpA-like peptidoglycan-associated protein
VNGCPDTDGDGVADKDDSCPKQAGIVNGCPDTDGDGIADKDDKCPDQAGVVAKKGCPEEIKPVAEKKIVRDEKPEVTEAREKLASAARAVQFESAKAILKDASYDVLDEVVALMRKNPSYSLSISGYTDDVGDDETNLKLSQDRTKACYDYLIFRGIKAERIRYAGFGEARPIASNNTAEGREMNRRVEFELILE